MTHNDKFWHEFLSYLFLLGGLSLFTMQVDITCRKEGIPPTAYAITMTINITAISYVAARSRSKGK